MITTVFGLPGSGKSTYLAYLAKKALKQNCYDRVYCNYPVIGLNVYPITSLEDVVKYDIKNALVLFDEGSLQYDNRDFKTFPRDAVKAIALHRHFADDRSKRFDIVICTQQWDALDKKIRALSGQLIYCSKVGFLTMFRPISRCISISEDSSEIVSGYSLSGIFSAFFICRPLYYKYFDSFTAPARSPVPSQFLQSYDAVPSSVDLHLSNKRSSTTQKTHFLFRYFLNFPKQLKKIIKKKYRPEAPKFNV